MVLEPQRPRTRVLHDPFARRVLLAVTLTAAGMGVAPLVSDVGVHPADGPATLLWLGLSLFGVIYLAIVGLSVAWVVVRSAPGLAATESDHL